MPEPAVCVFLVFILFLMLAQTNCWASSVRGVYRRFWFTLCCFVPAMWAVCTVVRLPRCTSAVCNHPVYLLFITWHVGWSKQGTPIVSSC